jgi:hypothetical protein
LSPWYIKPKTDGELKIGEEIRETQQKEWAVLIRVTDGMSDEHLDYLARERWEDPPIGDDTNQYER